MKNPLKVLYEMAWVIEAAVALFIGCLFLPALVVVIFLMKLGGKEKNE